MPPVEDLATLPSRHWIAATAPADGVLTCAADLATRFAPWAMAQVERIAAVGLDPHGRVLSETVICGSERDVAVHPAALLSDAIAAGAVALALAHNHPSGNPQPSAADLAFTVRMQAACRVLGMRLVDHVIVASGGWQRIALDDKALLRLGGG